MPVWRSWAGVGTRGLINSALITDFDRFVNNQLIGNGSAALIFLPSVEEINPHFAVEIGSVGSVWFQER